MKYAYLLDSLDHPGKSRAGLIDDPGARLPAHNAGRSPRTARLTPWRLVTYVAFSRESKAVAFERYLKSASGRAFARKHLR